MNEKFIALKAIKVTTADFDTLEKRIRILFRKEIYFPLLARFGESRKTLKNAVDDFADLIEALFSGRITFYRGSFSGKLNAEITKDLRKLGATYDRKTGSYNIRFASLPMEMKSVIAASEAKFEEKLKKIDDTLAQILPEEIAAKLKAADLFDATLWKTDKDFRESVKGITVAPQLSDQARAKIASEWENNMQLYIKDWTETQITKLRADIQERAFSGQRREISENPIFRITRKIQESDREAMNKAKFLAKQETSLLMSKFKESRYVDAGVHEYLWNCVAGSKAHPVRPRHFALAQASKKGKVYRWDDPPITTEPGQPVRKNNPGCDYGCRCSARPVVRFRS